MRTPIKNGKPSTPTMANRKKNRIAPMIAPTTLMPSQSATRMSPGFPASAKRFSVVARTDELATRFDVCESRATSGRSVRSMNGAWSSSSSRFFACIDPSWVRRAWTGSTGALPARPRTMSRMPAAARPATRIAMMGIRLDLDVHDLADEQEAEEHHETAEHQDDHAGRKAEDRRWIQEHRCHEARRDDEQDSRQADRQARDHVARQSLLRGERPDLALDAD